MSGKRNAKICSVVFSYYPGDVRVRREAEALVAEGFDVDVVCLRGKSQPRRNEFKGVSAYRLPMDRSRAGRFRYVYEYLYFILLSFIRLSLLHLRKRYRVVHIHNMPDILVFVALIPKLTGAKVLLDLHDPMPEVYMAKYSLDKTHSVIRALICLERLSIRFADSVITPNIAFRDLFVARGCPERKIGVVMNSPQEDIFVAPQQAGRCERDSTDKFVVMYHGTIVERSGIHLALEALSRVSRWIPNITFDVYGEGDFVERFLELVARYNLAGTVQYHGYVPLEEIAATIPSIDLGLIPNLRNPFTELNLPVRIFEYLSMDKPVVVPRTKGIMDYFPPDSLHFFEPGNAESLARVILDMYTDQKCSRKVLERGQAVYRRYHWQAQRKNLQEIVCCLV